MSPAEKIVVIDACIIIDLIDLNLLRLFHQLTLQVLTTPQVIAEITDEKQITEVNISITNKNLKIYSGVSLESIMSINNSELGLSFTDLSVINSAERLEGIILSSDRRLRNEADNRNLSTRGFLWIVEELILVNLISTVTALEILKKYVEINIRAPKDEIKKLIIKLENQLQTTNSRPLGK